MEKSNHTRNALLFVPDISGFTQFISDRQIQHNLKDRNIIEARREGQTIYYSLKEEHLKILKPFFKYINQQNLKMQHA